MIPCVLYILAEHAQLGAQVIPAFMIDTLEETQAKLVKNGYTFGVPGMGAPSPERAQPSEPQPSSLLTSESGSGSSTCLS